VVQGVDGGFFTQVTRDEDEGDLRVFLLGELQGR
jgi:hypothetical protein